MLPQANLQEEPKQKGSGRYDYKKHDEEIQKLVEDSRKQKMNNMQVKKAVAEKYLKLGLSKEQRSTAMKRLGREKIIGE